MKQELTVHCAVTVCYKLSQEIFYLILLNNNIFGCKLFLVNNN